MTDPLEIELPHDLRIILRNIAEAGILGETAEDVVAYLVTRAIEGLLLGDTIKLSVHSA